MPDEDVVVVVVVQDAGACLLGTGGEEQISQLHSVRDAAFAGQLALQVGRAIPRLRGAGRPAEPLKMPAELLEGGRGARAIERLETERVCDDQLVGKDGGLVACSVSTVDATIDDARPAELSSASGLP